MIKIICGVYGHYVTDPKTGKSRVVPKDKNSKPFELEPEQEARLVGLGVAKYVNAPVPEETPEAGESFGHLDPEQLEEMTNAKLKELAEDMGIETKKLTTKAKLIEAITAANVAPGPAVGEDGEGTEGDGEDDGAPLPEFDPAEAVQ